MARSNAYPERFFEVQLIFARKVAEVTGRSFEDAVLHNTAMYRILGLDWSADPTHPTWQAYVRTLQSDKEQGAKETYHYYLSKYDELPKSNGLRHWGCFSHEYLPDEHRIMIHFSNQDLTGYGPLSHQRMAIRKQELKEMFTHIRDELPDTEIVTGGSWLYNLDAYKRLFPVEYGQSAKEADRIYYLGRGLWGQFLNSEWQANEPRISTFLQRIETATNEQEIDRSFPFQTLFPKAPIPLFYQFYDIQ